MIYQPYNFMKRKKGTINNKSASVTRKNETAGLVDVLVSFPCDVICVGLMCI